MDLSIMLMLVASLMPAPLMLKLSLSDFKKAVKPKAILLVYSFNKCYHLISDRLEYDAKEEEQMAKDKGKDKDKKKKDKKKIGK